MSTDYQKGQDTRRNDLKQTEKCTSKSQVRTNGLSSFSIVILSIVLSVVGGCCSHHRSAIPTSRLPGDWIPGQWVTVDFVQNLEDFILNKRHWTDDFSLKGLTFYNNGTTSGPWIWTKNWLIHPGDHTAAHYVIIDIEATPTLFMEWINGDVTMRRQQPWYYVLRKAGTSTPLTNQTESLPVVLSALPEKDIVLHRADCTADYVESALGTPNRIGNDGRMLRYTDAGIDFWFSQNGPLSEVHLNQGCRAHLKNGISLTSTKEDVFALYGEPVRIINTDDLHRKNDDGVLYQKDNTSRIYYGRHGLIFWFRGDAINQIVVFKGRITAE